MTPADDPKKRLRAHAVAQRRSAHLTRAADAADSVRRLFLQHLPPPAGAVVAGYWPMGDELDVRPLLAALSAVVVDVALPVVADRRQPLDFRLWRPGEPLEPGAHGTSHPAASAPVVAPTVVLVPLLAFDTVGWRLGYGGGYYDRTLARLRQTGSVTAVGIAYAAQRVEAVPHGGHDERMDWIVTEESVLDTRWIRP